MKPHDSVPWPRVNRNGLRPFLYIFWDSSNFLHDRLLEKALAETPAVNCEKLTQVADKYRSHNDKTSKSCGPVLVQDNAHKQTTNQTKNGFFYLEF